MKKKTVNTFLKQKQLVQKNNLVQEDIKQIRKSLNISQTQFAYILNINVGTLRNWEQGISKPTDAGKSLIQIAEKYPEILIEVLHKQKIKKKDQIDNKVNEEKNKEDRIEQEKNLWQKNKEILQKVREKEAQKRLDLGSF